MMELDIKKVNLDNTSRKGEYYYIKVGNRSHYYKADVPEYVVVSWVKSMLLKHNLTPQDKRKTYNKIKREMVSNVYTNRKTHEIVKNYIKLNRSISKPKEYKISKSKVKYKAKDKNIVKSGVFSVKYDVRDLYLREKTIAKNLFSNAGIKINNDKQLNIKSKIFKNNFDTQIDFIGYKSYRDKTDEVLASINIHGKSIEDIRKQIATKLLSIEQEKSKASKYLRDVLMNFVQYNLKTYSNRGVITNVNITTNLRV